jgi:hypothetical protein
MRRSEVNIVVSWARLEGQTMRPVTMTLVTRGTQKRAGAVAWTCISNMAKYLFLMDTFLRFSLLIRLFSDPFPVQLILIHDMASIS